jgi:hypothetical protein
VQSVRQSLQPRLDKLRQIWTPPAKRQPRYSRLVAVPECILEAELNSPPSPVFLPTSGSDSDDDGFESGSEVEGGAGRASQDEALSTSGGWERRECAGKVT